MPDHFCPGCGVTLRAFARYPWYFCQPCVKRAKDGAGRALKFANTSLGGGFAFAYADVDAGSDEWISCGHVLCQIGDRPVLVGEARFGGIVAEPVPDRPLGNEPYNMINLRGENRHVPDPSKGADFRL